MNPFTDKYRARREHPNRGGHMRILLAAALTAMLTWGLFTGVAPDWTPARAAVVVFVGVYTLAIIIRGPSRAAEGRGG